MIRTTPFAAFLVFAAGSAHGQALAPPAGPYDCVIEPREIADVASQAEGVLAEVFAERGDVVKKGDVLARLAAEVEEANLALAELRAANDSGVKSSRQRTEYFNAQNARSQKLLEEGSLPAAAAEKTQTERRLAYFELEAAVLEAKIAEAEVGRADALLEQKILRAPFDGVVVDRFLSPGGYSSEQAPAFRIAQVDPLNVEVFAPVDLYPRLGPETVGEVTLQPPFRAVHRAKVAVVDRVFDAASGTFGVRLTLPNPDGKIPAGLRCTVRFLQNPS